MRNNLVNGSTVPRLNRRSEVHSYDYSQNVFEYLDELYY